MSSICNYVPCSKSISGLDVFNCKYCHGKFCIEHKLDTNHDCPKTKYAKFIEKHHLLKKGEPIMSGRYYVICKECQDVVSNPLLLENAGKEMEKHTQNTGHDQVKLKEAKPPEISFGVSIRETSDEYGLWTCGLCVPPRKFDDKDDYIRHHYFHE